MPATIITTVNTISSPPADAPVISYPGQVLYSDAFSIPGTLNIADAGLGGRPWTWGGIASAYTVSGGVATKTGDASGNIGIDETFLDVEVSVAIMARPPSGYTYICARKQGGSIESTSMQRYALRLTASDVSAGFRLVGPNDAQLSALIPFSAGDTLGLRIKSGVVSALHNGSVVASNTPTSLLPAGHVVIFHAATAAGLALDNFVVRRPF